MNLNKAIKAFLLCAFALVLLSSAVEAQDWYVRPDGGNYGKEDGTSYTDSWPGLQSVVWGDNGVKAGDNLYVCGLHLRTRTAGSAWEMISPGANGTGEDARITIRGDYPGDPGIIWGAGIMAHEPWVNEGNNVWSITCVGASGPQWFFEDITKTSWTILDMADTLAECESTPGSYYCTDYTAGSQFYVHCSDNGNPTNRIAANRLGYHVNLYNGAHYITWLNLKFYCIFRWMNFEITPATHVSYIRWKNCISWYGEFALFFVRNYHHHLEFINCDLGWAKNGIGFSEYPRDGNFPHHFVIRGCRIHDIGVRYGNADAHAISGNGANDGLIEYNEIYNAGSGITWYEFTENTSMKNVIIRWNYIHDTHKIPASDGRTPNSRGIEFNMTGYNTSDKSGNKCYGNIVANVADVAYRQTWAEYQLEFFNNVAYNCGTSFYLYHGIQDVGPNVKLRNNISLYPKAHHMRFSTTASDFVLDSDYNLFYPTSGTDFFVYFPGVLPRYDVTFSEWQAMSVPGSTFDAHSIAADPLFVDPDNGDFRLKPNSPAIDAGIDVGLTRDFDGNPVPVGTAPDIGAYEYVPVPGTDAFAIDPNITSLYVYNNIIKKPGNTSAMILCNLEEGSALSLKIYNAKGAEITSLCDEYKIAGIHTYNWAGLDSSNKKVGSGIYMIHMKAEGYTETKKIAVVK